MVGHCVIAIPYCGFLKGFHRLDQFWLKNVDHCGEIHTSLVHNQLDILCSEVCHGSIMEFPYQSLCRLLYMLDCIWLCDMASLSTQIHHTALEFHKAGFPRNKHLNTNTIVGTGCG